MGYEARIDGLEEHSGMCDVAAFSVDMIGAIACVANNLRYEWQHYTGVYGPNGWTYNFASSWPNEVYPDA